MVVTNQHDRRGGRFAVVVTIALLLAMVTSACAFPEEAFDGSLEGTYYINGFDQGGTEYGGVLIIDTTATPNIYEMQWIITGSLQAGTGTVSGNQLNVDWDTIEGFDASTRGTAVYEITGEGALLGERIVDGEDGIGTEEAFPIR